eukprot:122776-Pelagomonas_calceolata.AAC.1
MSFTDPFAGWVICWIWSHQIDLKDLCGGHFECFVAGVCGVHVSFMWTSLSCGPLACVLRCYGNCLPGCRGDPLCVKWSGTTTAGMVGI